MKKNEKGITLIALIITIIVMLILVAVSIQLVINSGLMGKAKEAASQTQQKYSEEANIEDHLEINVDGTIYNNIEDIVD